MSHPIAAMAVWNWIMEQAIKMSVALMDGHNHLSALAATHLPRSVQYILLAAATVLLILVLQWLLFLYASTWPAPTWVQRLAGHSERAPKTRMTIIGWPGKILHNAGDRGSETDAQKAARLTRLNEDLHRKTQAQEAQLRYRGPNPVYHQDDPDRRHQENLRAYDDKQGRERKHLIDLYEQRLKKSEEQHQKDMDALQVQLRSANKEITTLKFDLHIAKEKEKKAVGERNHAHRQRRHAEASCGRLNDYYDQKHEHTKDRYDKQLEFIKSGHDAGLASGLSKVILTSAWQETSPARRWSEGMKRAPEARSAPQTPQPAPALRPSQDTTADKESTQTAPVDTVAQPATVVPASAARATDSAGQNEQANQPPAATTAHGQNQSQESSAAKPKGPKEIPRSQPQSDSDSESDERPQKGEESPPETPVKQETSNTAGLQSPVRGLAERLKGVFITRPVAGSVSEVDGGEKESDSATKEPESSLQDKEPTQKTSTEPTVDRDSEEETKKGSEKPAEATTGQAETSTTPNDSTGANKSWEEPETPQQSGSQTTEEANSSSGTAMDTSPPKDLPQTPKGHEGGTQTPQSKGTSDGGDFSPMQETPDHGAGASQNPDDGDASFSTPEGTPDKDPGGDDRGGDEDSDENGGDDPSGGSGGAVAKSAPSSAPQSGAQSTREPEISQETPNGIEIEMGEGGIPNDLNPPSPVSSDGFIFDPPIFPQNDDGATPATRSENPSPPKTDGSGNGNMPIDGGQPPPTPVISEPSKPVNGAGGPIDVQTVYKGLVATGILPPATSSAPQNPEVPNFHSLPPNQRIDLLIASLNGPASGNAQTSTPLSQGTVGAAPQAAVAGPEVVMGGTNTTGEVVDGQNDQPKTTGTEVANTYTTPSNSGLGPGHLTLPNFEDLLKRNRHDEIATMDATKAPAANHAQSGSQAQSEPKPTIDTPMGEYVASPTSSEKEDGDEDDGEDGDEDGNEDHIDITGPEHNPTPGEDDSAFSPAPSDDMSNAINEELRRQGVETDDVSKTRQSGADNFDPPVVFGGNQSRSNTQSPFTMDVPGPKHVDFSQPVHVNFWEKEKNGATPEKSAGTAGTANAPSFLGNGSPSEVTHPYTTGAHQLFGPHSLANGSSPGQSLSVSPAEQKANEQTSGTVEPRKAEAMQSGADTSSPGNAKVEEHQDSEEKPESESESDADDDEEGGKAPPPPPRHPHVPVTSPYYRPEGARPGGPPSSTSPQSTAMHLPGLHPPSTAGSTSTSTSTQSPKKPVSIAGWMPPSTSSKPATSNTRPAKEPSQPQRSPPAQSSGRKILAPRTRRRPNDSSPLPSPTSEITEAALGTPPPQNSSGPQSSLHAPTGHSATSNPARTAPHEDDDDDKWCPDCKADLTNGGHEAGCRY